MAASPIVGGAANIRSLVLWLAIANGLVTTQKQMVLITNFRPERCYFNLDLA